MKNRTTTTVKILAAVMIFMVAGTANVWAGEFLSKKKDAKQDIDTLTYDVFRGKVLDKATNAPLIFATLAVEGENTATITNSDGEFILKIKKNSKADAIKVAYLGYKNLTFPKEDLKAKRTIIKLESAVISLDEIKIYPGTPDYIIRRVLEKIPENYSTDANTMTAFYRESIQKRSSYVSLSEAVVKVKKASYTKDINDQLQIFKARKGTDVKKMDTLLFKLQGGPYTTLLLDIIKNPSVLLFSDMIKHYEFNITNVVKINDKLNYVIEFHKKWKSEFPLYDGRFYVEIENLALTAADFSLNLEDDEDGSMLIRKKPIGVKVNPEFANYSVNYREQDGKWYFNYARGEVRFKIKWEKKLFYTTYTTMTEMAITDRIDEVPERMKNADRFKINNIMSEEVDAFADKDYWGEYNYIEPDQSIQTAIKKLKKLN